MIEPGIGVGGKTIKELFVMSGSDSSHERHSSVTSLINVLRSSKRLQHAHHFNVPMVIQILVETNLLFLARWLLDDAGMRLDYLEDALPLLHAVIVDENSDHCILNWPELRLNARKPRLMSHDYSHKGLSSSTTEISKKNGGLRRDVNAGGRRLLSGAQNPSSKQDVVAPGQQKSLGAGVRRSLVINYYKLENVSLLNFNLANLF